MPIKIVRRTLEYRGEARDLDNHLAAVLVTQSSPKRFGGGVEVMEIERKTVPPPAPPAKKGERVPVTLQGVQLICASKGCKNDIPTQFRCTFQIIHPEPMKLLSFECTKCWRSHPV